MIPRTLDFSLNSLISGVLPNEENMSTPKYTTQEAVDFVKRSIADRRKTAEGFDKTAKEAEELGNQERAEECRQSAQQARTHADIQENTLAILFP